jgi:hypothetical protein
MNLFPFRKAATPSLALAAGLLAAFTPSVHGCSVCGCSLSSDWAAQGYGMSPGLEESVNFQYYNQNNLRSGTGSVDKTLYPFPDDREIQQDTLTRSTVLGLDYGATPNWGFELQIPYFDRFHSTVAQGDTQISESHADGIGDIRLLARYQVFHPSKSFGIQFGLKLPTGEFDQNFATGPQTGNLVDRGLQLGTGTTDALLGISYFGRPMSYLGYFAQATVQHALGYRDAFMPSSTLNLNVGVRYLNTSIVTPLIQLNARWDSRERGYYADIQNSGDAAFYISPGLTVQMGATESLFAFVQVPVYQRVNGLQLDARWLLSIGFRFRI